MLRRHVIKIRELIQSDEELAEAIFLYEMDNHEYAINWDADDDTLGSLGLKLDDLATMHLESAYKRARREHFRRMEENGVI